MRQLSLLIVVLLGSNPLVAHGQSAATATIPPAADAAFFSGDWARAKSLFDEFLKAHPASPGARVKAGYVELGLGQLDAARMHFERVIAGAGTSGAPVAQAGMAIALARAGQTAEALQRLEAAMQAGYANHAVLDQEAAFGSLRTDARFVKMREQAMTRAMPCMGDSTARAFDFWIGEWDVYVTGTAQVAGRSRIDRVSGGCAILENWTGNASWLSPPSDGKSLNFVVPGTGKWRQVWMGSGGGLTAYDEGEYRDGAMRFTYDNTTPRGRVKGRFQFHNLGPNRVRQVQESTPDEGKTWQTVYDFTYIRKGSGESPVTTR
jgi:hypothetical protein